MFKRRVNFNVLYFIHSDKATSTLIPVVKVLNYGWSFKRPDKDGCNSLKGGVTCPLQRGQPVTYILNEPLPFSYFPVILELSFVDQFNNVIACKRTRVKFENNQSWFG